MLTLVVTEIAEAVEELRKNMPPIYGIAEGGLVSTDLEAIRLANMKPEGELSELADVAIRLLDFAGCISGFDFDALRAQLKTEDSPFGENEEMRFYYELIHAVTSMQLPREWKVVVVIHAMDIYCNKKGWDLWAAIDLKVAYNETRSHRHGGKKY